MPTTTVPADFWGQIDHQLDRIAAEQPATFDAVRAILLDPGYDQVLAEAHRNGVRTFDADSAFFAGSGGDRTVAGALRTTGWQTAAIEASYFYVMTHPGTGETLTYIEGDVVRGDQMS